MFKLIYFLCLLLIIKCYIICKMKFVVKYLYLVGILNPKFCVLNYCLLLIHLFICTSRKVLYTSRNNQLCESTSRTCKRTRNSKGKHNYCIFNNGKKETT